MTGEYPTGIVQSVKQRLLNQSHQSGEAFNRLLVRYAIERLLHRLAESTYGSSFVLKGAMLFNVWSDQPYRSTKDIDLLGPVSANRDSMRRLFREICYVKVDNDGMTFDPDSVKAEDIREEQVYHGIRVTMTAWLGKARMPLQIDIGVGDVITPAPQQITFGPLLDMPAPMLFAYPPETVVAEKLETIVQLGVTNSRMKDYYDLWWMCTSMTFDGEQLRRAIEATFKRRRTELPGQTASPGEPVPSRALRQGSVPVWCPPGLRDEYASDSAHAHQWSSFLQRAHVSNDPSLRKVVQTVRSFAIPLLHAVSHDTPMRSRWDAGTWQHDSP